MNVAVIGAGIFGVLTALRLSFAGHAVTIFERESDIMLGASLNNQNRLHLGYHYPRDSETAQQCILGFEKFKQEFSDCLLTNFSNAYFIAQENSLTSPEAFLKFCVDNNLPCEPIDLPTFEPRVANVALGICTHETVFDSSLVRAKLWQRIAESDISVRLACEIWHINRTATDFRLFTRSGSFPFDAVVNCCYADINRFSSELGYTPPLRQFQYTTLAIISLPWELPTGIIVLDGKFTSILPFGRTGNYILSHVEHTVIARETAPRMQPEWRAGTPFQRLDKERWFENIIADSGEFIPDLTSAKLQGFLHGPRMLLASAYNDARPSIVEQPMPGENYVTVFSGKIDHAIWVPDAVLACLQ